MKRVARVMLGVALTLLGRVAGAQPAPAPVPMPVNPPEPPKMPATSRDAGDEAPPLAPPTRVRQPVVIDAAPPPPPAAGETPAASGDPIPPVPMVFPNEIGSTEGAVPLLAGWRDGFYIRDAKDRVRIYPKAFVQVDYLAFLGAGVSQVPTNAGADLLKNRMTLRRARLELGGEVFHRWSFLSGIEMTTGRTGNPTGTDESSAAPAGSTPTSGTAQYAAAQTSNPRIQPYDVWVNYKVMPIFNLMFGQYNVPFSLQNRTKYKQLDWQERSVPIRFALASPKDIGLTVWGSLHREVFAYEIGVFGGGGQNRPSVDGNVDFMGRMYLRPLASGATCDFCRYLQVGVSGRHGVRDPKSVLYDVQGITTNNGFSLWSPGYKDSAGRKIHVLPSGDQNAIGGELRMVKGPVALQGEVIYQVDNTREAVDGFQATNTERLGRIKAVDYYAQVSFWPVGDPFVNGEPGLDRPTHMDLGAREPERLPRGIEMMALIGGVNGNYSGATRKDSVPDSKTPATAIKVIQFGLGIAYWHTQAVKLSLDYNLYATPGSGDVTKNLAVVPDNLVPTTDGAPHDSHVLHELGIRMQVAM